MANARPEVPSGTTDSQTEQPAAANRGVNSSSPPDEAAPGQLHVETPFVFSAAAAALPGGVAQIDFSTLPNVFLAQEEVDPVVLTVKAETPKPSPSPAASPKSEPIHGEQGETANPSKGPENKKEKKGLLARVKGFLGSIFRH